MAVLNTKLLEKQTETLADANEKLDKYGKCLMVRPTGFGKTYSLIEGFTKPYIQSHKGRTVLYVYPLDIIKTEITAGKKRIDEDGKEIITPSKYLKDGKIKLKGKNTNMIFKSYQELSRKFNEDNEYWRNYFIEHNVGLIILDEAHRAGSEKFYEIYNSFKDMVGPDGIRIVGATATPDRMDDSDEKMSVLEEVFDNIQTFKYDLGDAINDGIIPELVIKVDQYAVEILGEKVRKNAKSKFKEDFDEQSFNVELGKIRAQTGREPETIAEAVYEAGYKPEIASDKYYKFIVFFTDIQHMIDEGSNIEEQFKEAFNKIIKTKSKLKKEFTVRTSYIASADTNGEIHKIIKQKPDTRKFYNKTKYVEEIIEQDYFVDILLTVDMINMGYHVDNITGVVMKRGTKSEIVYMQQIGRAISVSAEHSPIIIDSVNNVAENFWFKKNAKDGGPGAGRGPSASGEEREQRGLNIKYEYIRTLDGIGKFMERYNCDDNMVERLYLEFLYLDRKMPLYIASSTLHLTIKELIAKLIKYEIPIRKEDTEAQRVEAMCDAYKTAKDKDRFVKEVTKLRFINSKIASYNDGNSKYIKNKQTSTLYDTLNHIKRD